MFTDRGYIAYKGYYSMEEVMNGSQSSRMEMGGPMILLSDSGNGEESIPLELPTASSQVEEIDIRLDDICSGEGNFRISDVKSSVKGSGSYPKRRPS